MVGFVSCHSWHWFCQRTLSSHPSASRAYRGISDSDLTGLGQLSDGTLVRLARGNSGNYCMNPKPRNQAEETLRPLSAQRV